MRLWTPPATAIVLLPYDNGSMTGESRSRSSLDLPQHKLVRALQATGKSAVVVLLSDRPASINWIDRSRKRVLEPGMLNSGIGASSEDIRLNGSFQITETP